MIEHQLTMNCEITPRFSRGVIFYSTPTPYCSYSKYIIRCGVPPPHGGILFYQAQ